MNEANKFIVVLYYIYIKEGDGGSFEPYYQI